MLRMIKFVAIGFAIVVMLACAGLFFSTSDKTIKQIQDARSKANATPSAPTTSIAPPPVAVETIGTSTDAIAFGKKWLLSVLRNPLNASFPFFGVDATYDPRLKAWSVYGVVDAKNDLGAVLTKEWKAVVFIDRSNSWRCRYLEFDGEPKHIDSDTLTQAPDNIEGNMSPASRAAEEAEGKRIVEAGEKAMKDAKKDMDDMIRKARRPKDAAAKLGLAKKLLKDGKTAAGKRFLAEIIKDFPETDAAKEAKVILGK